MTILRHLFWRFFPHRHDWRAVGATGRYVETRCHLCGRLFDWGDYSPRLRS